MSSNIIKATKQFLMATKSFRQGTRVIGSELKARLCVPTLRSVEFQVTHHCNLKCAFCYARDIMSAKKNPNNMPFDIFKSTVDTIYKLGIIHINITGGEPLIRSDIIDIISYIPKDVIVTLVTNSTLLTKDKINSLKKANLSTIQMSYGSNYKNFFNREMAQFCIKQGISVTLSILNTFEERPHNEEALKLAKDDGYNILYNYPMRYCNSGLDSKFYWENRNLPIVREDNMFWSGRDICPAGIHKIYITNDGDIMSCDRIHEIYGNIHTDNIRGVWKTMAKKYKKNKSFCLLETDTDQWEINNKMSGKRYPVKNIGSSTNPFNIFDRANEG
ncbi:MAG: radical SAM protein [Oligoflexia bacterium]|nr:radical SAM protein [Oligoflexia bacterium]